MILARSSVPFTPRFASVSLESAVIDMGTSRTDSERRCAVTTISPGSAAPSVASNSCAAAGVTASSSALVAPSSAPRVSPGAATRYWLAMVIILSPLIAAVSLRNAGAVIDAPIS